MENQSGQGEARLVRTTDISETFPPLPDPCVDRPTILETLDELMSKDADIVFLDGDPDSGKTTVLAQYALRHEKRTICLFLRAVTELTYDPIRLKVDLCSQMTWILTGRRDEEDESADLARLRHLYHKLARRMRQDARRAFVVIDGLADIAVRAGSVQQELLQMLPIGDPNFRFLMSGNATTTGVAKLEKLSTRTQQINRFSLEETKRLFAGLASPKDVIEIHESCQGIPGRLASVRRFAALCANPEEVLAGLPTKAPEIFEREWGKAVPADGPARDLLVLVSFVPAICTKRSLAAILVLDEVELDELVARIPFVKFDPQRNRLDFVSDSFRRFAESHLRGDEARALSIAAKHAEGALTPAERFRALPEILERANDVAALVAYLGTETLSAVLAETKSANLIVGKLQHALRVVHGGPRVDAAVRYSIQGSALRSIVRRPGSKSQVVSGFYVYGIDHALEVANRAFTHEERVLHLAAIARAQKSVGEPVDAGLLQELETEAGRVDWAELQDQAFDVATEVLAVAPGTAMSILEQSVDRRGDPNALDVAIAAAFLRAATAAGANSYRREMFEQTVDRATSDEGRQLFASAAVFALGSSSEHLVRDLERLTGTAERVLLLRSWLQENPRHQDSMDVAGRLLSELLGDARYSPSASSFALIMRVVAGAESANAECQRLVQVVEAQLPQIKARGPIVGYVRVLCDLTEARARLGDLDPVSSVFDELSEAGRVEDAGICAESAAWVGRLGQRLERVHGIIGDSWGVFAQAASVLTHAVESILASSAEQSEALRSIVAPLLPEQFELVLDIVGRANTEARRDKLYRAMVSRLVGLDDSDIAAPECLRLCCTVRSEVRHPLVQRGVTDELVIWIGRKVAQGRLQREHLCTGIELALLIPDADIRCRRLAGLYRAAVIGKLDAEVISDTKRELDSAWTAVGSQLQQFQVAFAVAAILARCDKDLAEHFCRRGEELAASGNAAVGGGVDVLRRLVRLLARATAATERCGTGAGLWDRLWHFSGLMPTAHDQASIATFAALLVLPKRVDVFRNIVEEKLKPALRIVINDLPAMRTLGERCLIEAAPALWQFHSASIDQYLTHLDDYAREDAVDTIIQYLLYGALPGEPWRRSDRTACRLTPEIATDVVTLIGRLRTDDVICTNVSSFLEALREKGVDARINSGQRAEILRSVKDIVGRLLPEPVRGIRHEGYRVLVDAQLRQCERDFAVSTWKDLLNRSRGLPNVADSAFVSACLVELVPSKCSSVRDELFSVALEQIKKLPLLEDRIDRGFALNEAAKGLYSSDCKILLQALLTESMRDDRPSLDRRRARLVDMIYRLDSEAASSIVASFDDDPARKTLRVDVQRELALLESAQALQSAGRHGEDLGDVENLSEACHRDLARLQASRVTGRSFHQNVSLIAHCGRMSLAEAYPVLSYAIESTAIRYEGAAEGSAYARQLAVALVEGCELAFLAVRVDRGNPRRGVPRDGREAYGPASAFVGSGDYLAAVNFIRSQLIQSTSSCVKICDPYFRPTDIQFIGAIADVLPRAEFQVLTSRRALQGKSMEQARTEFEAEALRLNGERRPAGLRVVVAGAKDSGDIDIHNRWLLLEDLGVDLGTSVGSLGGQKSYAICLLDANTRLNCEARVDQYLQLQIRYLNDERVLFEAFTLV